MSPSGTWALQAVRDSGTRRALKALEILCLVNSCISFLHIIKLSNCVGPIRKYISPFLFVPRRQIKKEDGNRVCCPTPWFTFYLPGNRQSCWEVLRSWICVAFRRKNHTPSTSSVVFPVLKTIFVKLLETFYEIIHYLRRVICCWWWCVFVVCLTDEQKASSLISSRNRCQRSSPSQIIDTLNLNLHETWVQSLISEVVQWPLHRGVAAMV